METEGERERWVWFRARVVTEGERERWVWFRARVETEGERERWVSLWFRVRVETEGERERCPSCRPLPIVLQRVPLVRGLLPRFTRQSLQLSCSWRRLYLPPSRTSCRQSHSCSSDK